VANQCIKLTLTLFNMEMEVLDVVLRTILLRPNHDEGTGDGSRVRTVLQAVTLRNITFIEMGVFRLKKLESRSIMNNRRIGEEATKAGGRVSR